MFVPLLVSYLPIEDTVSGTPYILALLVYSISKPTLLCVTTPTSASYTYNHHETCDVSTFPRSGGN